MPMWLTEFAMFDRNRTRFLPCGVSNYSDGYVKQLINIAVSGLESRHFIQRYSGYFDLESQYRACRSLFDDNKRKTLTQFGRVYAGLDN
jgi:Glycosyl hydrolase catalytic core